MQKLIIALSIAFFFSAVFPVTRISAEVHAVDPDGDGWPDYYEEELGSDPERAASVPETMDDNDQDGLDNEKERALDTDPTGTLTRTTITSPMGRKRPGELPVHPLLIRTKTA